MNALARGAESNDLRIPTGEGRRRAEALHLVQSHALFDHLPDVLSRLVDIQKSGRVSSAKKYFELLRWLKRMARLNNAPQTYSKNLVTRVVARVNGRTDKNANETKV